MRKEDQLKINTFGRLNNRKHDLEEELKEKQAKHDLLDDAANEIILADDDEPIRCASTHWRRLPGLASPPPQPRFGTTRGPRRDRYGFGECYFECSKDQAEELLEQQKSEAEGEIAALTAEIKGIMDTLSGLKTHLCAAHRALRRALHRRGSSQRTSTHARALGRYGRFGGNINLEETNTNS